MQMQYKFTSRQSFKQTLIRKLIKILLVLILFVVAIFLLDKFDFPSPEKKINKEITDEIIKLK
tara:strand:- start:4271 stop:4459 length:189 start_codon:yes stop_codon:yes gene_type:complete